jgi:hypothetical protein
MPSTAIRTLSYDDDSRTMFVGFVEGDLYAYFDVPAELYQAFRQARSKGRFFAYKVRPRFRYQKVAEVSPSPAGRAWPPPAGAAH